MMTTLPRFARYCLVGLVNTAFHVLVFLTVHTLWGLSQTGSNLAAFMAAVSLSYTLNARFTFDSHRSWRRYGTYLGFMGVVSLVIGRLGDSFAWPSSVTLVFFCATSLSAGYLFSRHVVFTGRLS